MSQHKLLFDRNIIRVNSLCDAYQTIRTEDLKDNKDYKFTDILRSSVVLLHSSFEEYFRSVLRDILPNTCTEEDLKNIPFYQTEGRKDKITVGQLLLYNELNLSVRELIEKSISEKLDSTSFNNFADIANWAGKARIDLNQFKKQGELNKLIFRRHKIVHEADNKRTDDTYELTIIRENTVRDWISIVCNLVEIIEQQTSNKNEGDKNE